MDWPMEKTTMHMPGMSPHSLWDAVGFPVWPGISERVLTPQESEVEFKTLS